jgi:Cof subfamily protein (haloacid dehalogenase superfamily)
MGRKVVFLDVDGTLLNDHGRVPPSAAQAVREARENGHHVLLCTGRCEAELWPEVSDIGFDGFVGSAGAFVRVDGEILVHRPLSEPDTRRVQDYFARKDTDIYLEANDAIFATSATGARLRHQMLDAAGPLAAKDMLQGSLRFLDFLSLDVDPRDILKIMYFNSSVSADEIREEFGDLLEVVPASTGLLGSESGELMIAGVHKATGMAVVLERLGIAHADAIAIGDSYNDLEMLAAAGVGIAMGNAPQPVEDAADWVTADPDEDGVRLAFAHCGLVTA